MKKITLITTFLTLFVQTMKAQDNCSAALEITSPGLYTVGVINGSQVPSPICTPNGAIPQANIPAGHWYVYTPAQNYTVTISSDIPENTPIVDTRFHVYIGTCEALVCYSGDDDSGAGYSSVASFNVTAGTTYYIAWDNRWLNVQNNNGFSFQFTESTVVVPETPISYSNQPIPTINSQYNICVVDMNGDFLDDIVGISSSNMRVHYQTETQGVFTVADFPLTGSVRMPNWSLAAGDYNRDGLNDIVLGNGSGATILTSVNDGAGYSVYTPSDYIFSQRTNFADLNNDGNLDVFVCHDIAPSCYYLNDGNGNLTFYQATVTSGSMHLATTTGNYATLFTDFDNDGDTDVFVSKCSGPPCELYRYDGDGVYTNISALAGINVTPIQTWSSAISDFDNDGDMDIIITASSGTHRFFRNNLDGSTEIDEAFTNITAGSGWDTNSSTNIDNIAYDFDNDGKVDVLGGGNKIMFNQGDNVFAPVSIPGLSVSAVGDLNNDGFLDFQSGSTIKYAIPNENNWVKVALTGIQSNSNGIGARVEIYGAWGKQIRDVRSGEGFKYMSSLNAHFGIGLATEIDQIIVRWPSGLVDTIDNPEINEMLQIVEGETLSVNNNSFTNFKVYPNPATDIVTLQTSNNFQVVSAEIFDLNGRKVYESAVVNETISIQSLAAGTYILLAKDSEGTLSTHKLIKQ
ncbi:MAG: VCBS repeat-containing protein [Flavobacterium sp.]|nr:VCBS repeat-containing protein [Flavobacterium sp.]